MATTTFNLDDLAQLLARIERKMGKQSSGGEPVDMSEFTAVVRDALRTIGAIQQADSKASSATMERLSERMNTLSTSISGIEVRPVVKVQPKFEVPATPAPDLSELSALLAAATEDIREALNRPTLVTVEPPDLNNMTVTLGRLATESAADTQKALRSLESQMRHVAEVIAKNSTRPTRMGVGGGGGNSPRVVGAYAYAGGISGTPTIPPRARILSMTATAGDAAGSVTIDGGDSIPIPTSSQWVANPEANLVAPTVVFTDTESYFVDWVI